MTQEKLSELAKLSSDAKNSFSELVSAFGTHLMCVCVSRTWNHMISGWKPYKLCIVCVHCVLTLWVCLSVHIACVCVVFCLFYWFIGPHQSFTTLDEIVCFCHYKQDQNMPEQTSTVVVSHRSPSRLYLFFFFSFFFAPVDVNCGGVRTRYCQFALSRTHRMWMEKNCCNTSRLLVPFLLP